MSGFSAMVGNPPWDQVELNDDEYFSKFHDYDANSRNTDKKKWIQELFNQLQAVEKEYFLNKTRLERTASYLKDSGSYPLVSSGKCNLYSLFSEHFTTVIHPHGNIGIIVPTGIATDLANAPFFRQMTAQKAVKSILAFDHRSPHFKNVTMQFCILSLGGGHHDGTFEVATGIMDIREPWKERAYISSKEQISLVNPSTQTLPVFTDATHADIVSQVYRSSVYWGEPDDEWGIQLRQGLFNMATDSELFHTAAELIELGYTAQSDGTYKNAAGDVALQLYESKHFHQFDHRWMSDDDPDFDKGLDCEIDTQYYIAEDEVNRRKLNPSFPTVVYRLIARNTDPQTFIATMLPKAGVGHSAGVFQSVVDKELLLPLLGVLNSRLFDFIVKSKSSGANVSFFITKQLPLPPLEEFNQRINPKTGNLFRNDIAAIVNQLIPTTSVMANVFDLDEPTDWNDELRAALKSQLDELVFDYYGISEKMRQYVYIQTMKSKIHAL